MPARRPSSDQPESADTILGELRAQVRELIHQNNNEAQKSEARGRLLVKLEDVPSDIKEIKERLAELELVNAQRAGALSLGGWLLKSPVIAWLLAIATVIWMQFKGGSGQ